MQVKSLFPTPLLMTEVQDDSPVVPRLRETILRRHDESGGVTRSNDGGWQSADDFLQWSGEAGSTLMAGVAALLGNATAVMEDGTLSRRPLDWKFQAWANVNRKGNGNKAHIHPGSYWSGTFYVDDGGIDGKDHLGGAIEFSDPRGPGPLMYAPNVKMTFEGCVNAGLAERIYPKTGLLIIFPSWLPHSVTAYQGEDTRISIAFNCSLW